MNLKIFIFGVMVFSLISCEKAEYGDSNGTTDEGDGAKVTFSVTKFDQLSFSNTTRSVDISSLCTRIDLGVYDLSSKTRILKAGQSVDDKGFGSLSVKLAPGKYCVVAIAHSGSGIATMTNLEKITFPDNKLTDTFCYCDTIDRTYFSLPHIQMRGKRKNNERAFCIPRNGNKAVDSCCRFRRTSFSKRRS